MIEFRLLGPLEAWIGDRQVLLPPGKPRALLARLLLDANRVVPLDVLLEALWGTLPPASARKILQAHVSHLRRALGAGTIETRAPGYAIRIAPSELDLHRFEQVGRAAVAETVPTRRVALLGEALDLWRGPALVEFRHEPFAHAAARELAELRLRTLEQRIETELQLGEHHLVLAELERLVAAEPLRETLRALLMLALYRCGRQAEALDQYRQVRRLLADELGLEPGAPLQALERSILRHEARLEIAHPTGETIPGPIVAIGARLGPLAGTLCHDGRELILVELVASEDEIEQRLVALDQARRDLAAVPAVRTACFTTSSPAADATRLARETAAGLLVVGADLEEALGSLVAEASSDIAFVPRPELPFDPVRGPVLVPFGGGREEWGALELGAWIARAHGLPLCLLGTRANPTRRDASRTLAGASLALQRFSGVSARPLLTDPGAEGILAHEGSVIVASLPPTLDATRRTLVRRATIPVILVRRGAGSGGLIPLRTLTRFSWSLPGELSPEHA